MVIGELLRQSGDSTYYSPWFDRGGDQAVFRLQCIAFSTDNLFFTVTVQTKNRDEVDTSATDKDSSIAGTLDPGMWSSGLVTGFKELVRYKFSFSDAFSGTAEWIHFTMLTPTWLRN